MKMEWYNGRQAGTEVDQVNRANKPVTKYDLGACKHPELSLPLVGSTHIRI